MNVAKEEHGLTRKELVEATGCPPYLIAYYYQCGYLPILRPSTGPGDPVLYRPDALDVIRERMSRRRPQNVDKGMDTLNG